MNNQHDHIGQQTQHIAPQVHVSHAPIASSDGLDFLSQDNRQAEYEKAVKHSSKVKFWKIAFPVIGCFIILGIASAMVLNSLLTPDTISEVINIENEGLVMENPRLNGTDENQRPYNLSANRAVQDVKNPTTVELQKIYAELPLNDTDIAKVVAGLGTYDAELKTLVLDEEIHVETTNGLFLDLKDADVDIEKGILKTSKAVKAKSPQAEISSDGLYVEKGGKSIVFTGNVRMVLYPDKIEKDGN